MYRVEYYVGKSNKLRCKDISTQEHSTLSLYDLLRGMLATDHNGQSIWIKEIHDLPVEPPSKLPKPR